MTFRLLGVSGPLRQDLGSKVLGRTAADKSGEGRGRVLGKPRSPGARRSVRKCGWCPVAPVSLAGIVHGPRHLLAGAGGRQWGDLPGVFSRGWVTPSTAHDPHPPCPGEAKCRFAPSGFHGNHPDSVNPCFPCFKQTRLSRISGSTVKVKTRLSLSPVC